MYSVNKFFLSSLTFVDVSDKKMCGYLYVMEYIFEWQQLLIFL